MSVELTIEVASVQGADTVQHALQSYQTRLKAGIARTRRRLEEFEKRYAVSTEQFLAEWSAEDLAGRDLEYVEWAGEAKLLAGLERELDELENARIQLQ
ncbi:MAG: hypothetical protein KDE20_00985 [Caldilineaceae bacterium]|nr:hypothetical protein [Caldilineaceae bacterium]